jgi:hypothetical protein
MTAVKKTITSIFFVPTLKIGKERLTKHGYINGYQKDTTGDHSYDDCIYILFKPEEMDSFRDFLEEEYDRTKSIIDDYDYEGGYVVVVYKLNPKFKKDFELVKKGKYSKTSSDFQALFPKVIKINKNGYNKDEISLQYRVFNKTEDLKTYWEEKLGVEFDENMELWDIYEEGNEILDIEKIKQHV